MKFVCLFAGNEMDRIPLWFSFNNSPTPLFYLDCLVDFTAFMTYGNWHLALTFSKVTYDLKTLGSRLRAEMVL